MFRKCVLFMVISMLLSISGWNVSEPKTASAENLPKPNTQSASTQAGSTCVNDWYVSYSGVTSYELLWTDPDAIPIEDLRFDFGYHNPFITKQGYLNFDADNHSDVFSTISRSDGTLQWRYWDSNSSGWNNLAYAYDPLNTLRFGDFEGDSKTDVFTVLLRQDGNYQWLISDDGISNYKQLNYSAYPIQSLRFGDFNADFRTDVFAAILKPGGVYEWVYSSGGIGDFTPFFSNGDTRDVNTASLAFGDVQGPLGTQSDAATDIFQILPNGGPFGFGTPEYVWLNPSTASYSNPTAGNYLNELRFGNFDGDYYTDIFFLTERPDGLYQWKYISGKDRTVHTLAYAEQTLAQLRFGQFNNDRWTDVFMVQPRCQMWIPTLVR